MSFTALPLELFALICGHLDRSDWLALRITCRAALNKTLEVFAKRYYTSLRLLLTTESLRRLERIAANDTLRLFVQELWIVPTLFQGRDRMTYSEFSCSVFGNRARDERKWDEAELKARYAAFRAIEEDHRAILKSSGLRDTLEKCIPRFENAVAFGLQSYPMETLLHSAEGNYVRCIGLPELTNQLSYTGRPSTWFHIPFPQVIGNTHALAFSALVEVIIKSKRKIRKLHTCNGTYFCGLSLWSLHLTQSQYKQLLCLISGELECLHICLRLSHKRDPDEIGICSLLDILVTAAPTLKTLVFSQWIPKYELNPRYFESLSRSVHFAQLQDLSLQSIEVTVDTLKAFLDSAASTLRRLTLKSVGLRDPIISAPDPGSMDGESEGLSFSPETVAEITRLWQLIFDWLGTNLRLEYFRFQNPGYRGRHMRFTNNPLNSQSGRPESDITSRDSACYDGERATVSFDTWIQQLRVEMSHPRILMDLPGTNNGQWPSQLLKKFINTRKGPRVRSDRLAGVSIRSPSSACFPRGTRSQRSRQR